MKGKYLILQGGKWVRATNYNLEAMHQIKVYDDNLNFIAIGLVPKSTSNIHYTTHSVK